MRILLIAVAIFITIHLIRTDLMEGTISFASFSDPIEQCEERLEITTIPIITVEGDTIESLFALYPDPESGFIERLSIFYTLNPHLKKQKILAGEKVSLPLTRLQVEKCTDYNG
jgi:hypothetical protein